MSLFLTFTPSSKRNRFSSRIFREKGNRSTPWDFRAARLRISYFCLPTSSVVFALKLSVMFPPAKKKNYKRRRARRAVQVRREIAARRSRRRRDRPRLHKIPHTGPV